MQTKLRNIFFLLFALSGFSGLIYESIWTHYLKLFLGHAAYAQSLVLAIFMGGMAIGSWVCSKYSTRWKNLLMVYAYTEGIIGLFALMFHDAFHQMVDLSYSAIITHLDAPVTIGAFKWVLSAFLILPQTILLGMTFPLMSAGIMRAFPQDPGRSVSLLYFTNSIGAAIGVIVSGFVLIRLVGLPGTIQIAGLINIALAIVVWLLARGETSGTFLKGELYPQEGEKGSGLWYRLFLVASLVTGAASFMYELGWIRMLSLVLGSSTHAFELMLSAFIFGLAFGGLWIKNRLDRIVNPVRFLVIVQILMGLLALSTLPLYGSTFNVMQWMVNTLSKTDSGYTLFNISSHAIASAIMLPTTFFAGMTLPLLTFILIQRGHGEQSIGAVYAANTVGAIIGVFFTIHIGMPLLGLKGLISVGAGLDMALGLSLLWSTTTNLDGKRLPTLLTALCSFAIASTLLFVELNPYKMASGVYRNVGLLTPENSRLLYHKDGKTATVSLSLLNNGVMSILTNGKSDAAITMSQTEAATVDEYTMMLAAIIPMSLHPQAETVANIGLGSGLTTHTLLSNHLLKQVDTVEIERDMVEAAKYFAPRVELVFKDPRSKIYIDDAKTFFSTRNRNYDIIVSEPSNPWVSGVAGLFSEEFYRLIKRHLQENGLFVQWVQLYEIDVTLVASVLKAISANFADFVIYAPDYGNLLIIAKSSGTIGDPDLNLLNNQGIAQALRRIHIESMQDIEVRKIGNKKMLGRLFETFPIRANSDYYPVLDQNAARTRFLRTNAQDLIAFSNEPLPAVEMLTQTTVVGDHTAVTPSPFFPKTQLAHTAMALRDYYLNGQFPSYAAELPVEIKEDALQFKRIFHECGSSSEQERKVFLFNTAKNLVPYLRPKEVEAVLNTVEAGRCFPMLTSTERNYLSFFKAVGARDAKKMASIAKTILESEHDITPARLKYLVAAGMIGNLVQGDRGEAARLYADYRERMFGTGRPGLLFRMLESNSAIP
jgi:spermidine synthase